MSGAIQSVIQSPSPSLKQLLGALQEGRGLPPAGAAGLVTSAQATDRDRLALLRKSIQTAIELELSTIPPYLCALWSIEDELGPAAKSIREVLQEEMLHMALACNLLVAIGGTPQIVAAAPHYPGPLPGGVHQGLVVQLGPYSQDALQAFMRIEYPAHPVEHDHAPGEAKVFMPETGDDTIGAFYEELEFQFHHLKPSLQLDRQIAGPLAWFALESLDDVTRAIELIKRQGEGSAWTPEDEGPQDLAHYYRFQELYEGQRLIWDAQERTLTHGDAIPSPDVLPMQIVPVGGYQRDQVTAEVWCDLERFDATYTDVLLRIERAWSGGGQASFLRALESMFALERYAKPLMRAPIPGTDKNYGPCFRIRKEASSE